MTMSMYSSYTPEDFNNIEEDIFGECGKTYRFQYIFGIAMPDRLGVVLLYLSLSRFTNVSRQRVYCMLQGLIILSIGHSTFEIYLTL